MRVSSVDDLEVAMDRDADLLIMAAAVSDFKVENPYPGKLKRSGAMQLNLVSTKDLIAAYASNHPKTFCVGFALAEQDADLETIARSKLWDKGLGLVVGNKVSALGAKSTEVLIVKPEGLIQLTGEKDQVAKDLIAEIAKEMS